MVNICITFRSTQQTVKVEGLNMSADNYGINPPAAVAGKRELSFQLGFFLFQPPIR